MSNLVDHAERELELAGLFSIDSDYNGMLGASVLELVKLFDSQRHSGMSARMTIDILSKLLSYQNLTPLTYEPDEWIRHKGMGTRGRDLWQNIRSSNIFSLDGGITHYDVNRESE